MVDYRHRNASRLNIPPAGLAARGEIVREKKVQYAYNPQISGENLHRVQCLMDEVFEPDGSP